MCHSPGRLRGELEGDAGQLRGAVGALHEAQIGAGDAVGDEIAVLLCIEGLDNLAIGVGIGDVAHVHGLVEKVATRCLHFLDGIGADGKRDAAVGELVERITCHLVGKLFGCSLSAKVCVKLPSASSSKKAPSSLVRTTQLACGRGS